MNYRNDTPRTIIPLCQLGELWDLCVDGADVIVGNEGGISGGLGSKQELNKGALSTTITKRFNHLQYNVQSMKKQLQSILSKVRTT